MSDCRKCADFSWCMENEECGLFKPKPQTNADRIRSMPDEELAEWMSANVANYARRKFSEAGVIEKYGDNGLIAKSWLDWLKEETDNE